jgi:hypothetical protein
MSLPRGVVRWLLVALVSFAAPAFGNPRPLAFTYQYATTPPGEVELEQYLDVIPTDVVLESGEESTRLRFDLQTELEIGLGSHWELGFYFVGRQPAEGDYVFRGVKQRVRGRFAEEGDLPIDLGVYLEIAEYRDKLELEQKLILQKRLGDLLLLANLSFEQEILYDGGDVEVVFNPSGGLSWAVTTGFNLGIEYRLDGEISELGEADHYLGPVVMLQTGDFFATVGGYAHLAGEGPGDFWARVLFGVGL